MTKRGCGGRYSLQGILGVGTGLQGDVEEGFGGRYSL